MDHIEAINEKFAERYLLGELTSTQRDEFEEHYFDCAICSEDVMSGAEFVDNLKPVLRERQGCGPQELPKPPFAGYGLPFQGAAWAFVGLLCVVGYENIVTIPALRTQKGGFGAPEIVAAIPVAGPSARAESEPVAAPPKKDFFFDLEIPAGPEFTSYKVEIRDLDGAAKLSLPIGLEQVKDTVRLAIPSGTLAAGDYNLLVLGEMPGGPARDLIRQAITVR